MRANVSAYQLLKTSAFLLLCITLWLCKWNSLFFDVFPQVSNFSLLQGSSLEDFPSFGSFLILEARIRDSLSIGARLLVFGIMGEFIMLLFMKFMSNDQVAGMS